jgi:hypothetical protein
MHSSGMTELKNEKNVAGQICPNCCTLFSFVERRGGRTLRKGRGKKQKAYENQLFLSGPLF